jgi:hypothetical protein
MMIIFSKGNDFNLHIHEVLALTDKMLISKYIDGTLTVS